MQPIPFFTGFALDSRAITYSGMDQMGFRCLDLLIPQPKETLTDYSARIAKFYSIPHGSPIGGFSLGGMVALEIARQNQAPRVILISSATHPRQLRPIIRYATPFATIAPAPILRGVFSALPRVLAKLGMHDTTRRDLLIDIMGHFPLASLRRFPRMILDWQGYEPTMPCDALHCQADWMLSPPTQLPGLRLIPGKDHLITMSRVAEVKAFLKDILPS